MMMMMMNDEELSTVFGLNCEYGDCYALYEIEVDVRVNGGGGGVKRKAVAISDMREQPDDPLNIKSVFNIQAFVSKAWLKSLTDEEAEAYNKDLKNVKGMPHQIECTLKPHQGVRRSEGWAKKPSLKPPDLKIFVARLEVFRRPTSCEKTLILLLFWSFFQGNFVSKLRKLRPKNFENFRRNSLIFKTDLKPVKSIFATLLRRNWASTREVNGLVLSLWRLKMIPTFTRISLIELV